jgi:phosphohistidine phosphatase
MKELIIIRHAKSTDAMYGASTIMSDFARELHEKGVHQAKEMANKLIKKTGSVDLLIASSAIRTLSTAKIFADAFQIDPAKIQPEPSLYNCSSATYYTVLAQVNDSVDSVAIFGHNPGITHFVQSLGVATIDAMPTCGVFGVKLHTGHWKAINDCKKDFWFFKAP